MATRDELTEILVAWVDEKYSNGIRQHDQRWLDDKVDTIFGGFQQPTSLRQRISQNRFATAETDWVIYAPNEPPRNVSETNEVDKEKHKETEAQKPITQKPNKFQLFQRP